MPRPSIGPVRCSGFAPVLACLGLSLAAAPAGAAGAFDGTYKGSQHVTLTNNSQQCDSANRDGVTLVIKDNHFNRGWYETILSVDVAADGAFHQSARFTIGKGRQSVVQIDGKITGNALEADIGTSGCAAHLSLTRS